jgi:hypothetical protein
MYATVWLHVKAACIGTWMSWARNPGACEAFANPAEGPEEVLAELENVLRLSKKGKDLSSHAIRNHARCITKGTPQFHSASLDFWRKLPDNNFTSYPADPPKGLSRVISFLGLLYAQ